MIFPWPNFRSFLRKSCNFFFRKLYLIRLTLAEQLLPNRFYIQELPYNCFHRDSFPGFREEIIEFNKGQGKYPRDANRWFMLKLLLNEVKSLPSGDCAELGTYKGKSARVIFGEMADNGKLYVFDTFEGFHESDIIAEKGMSSVKVTKGQYANTHIEMVRKYILSGCSQDKERLAFRKGLFPHTFSGLESNKWRFVHLDCDMAKPTRSALECFYPGLVPGGIILIHDFNGAYAEGIQGVVREFCRKNGAVLVPMPDGAGSAVIRKSFDMIFSSKT